MPPSSTQRTKKPATPVKVKQSSTGLIVVIVVAAVAVLAIVAAVVSQLGGDDGADGLKQTQNVAVEGEALVRYDDGLALDPAVGVTPPKLVGSSFDGTPVTIDPADGRAKMVVYFAHWCPVCQREVPVLVDWINAGKVPANVDVIGVSTAVTNGRDNYPPSSWLERVGWTKPVMADSSDSTAASAWGLPAYPYFVLVGSDGNVIARTTGALTPEQLDQFVALAQ